MAPFDIPQAQWDDTKEEVKQILVGVAKAQSLISYSELVAQLRTVSFAAHDQRLFVLLGEISSAEVAVGHPMLSALVVHKDDMRPGQGFFELASQLGRNVTDQERCWVEEVNRVYAQWFPTKDGEKEKHQEEKQGGQQPEENGWFSPFTSIISAAGSVLHKVFSLIFNNRANSKERLEELKNLFEQRLISEEEYTRKKDEILKQL